MRNLAILTFLTLDGVMQGPSSPEEDPSGGFTAGGWAAEFWGEVMAQVSVEAMSEPYDLLFGRKTYDIFSAGFADANADDALANMLNNAKKYVVTNNMDVQLRWRNSTPVQGGDVVAKISRLKREAGPLIQVHGSCRLIQTLLKHDLIDEFRLWTFPVALGQGMRLFGEGTMPRAVRLVKSNTTANGVVMGIYERAHAAQK